MVDPHYDPRPEVEIQADILLAVGSLPHVRLWRQNAGRYFHVSKPCPRCKHAGRWIQGAPPGAADLSGILLDGRRLEVEVKSYQGEMREGQANWAHMIQTRGGVFILARSVQDVLDALPCPPLHPTAVSPKP